MDGDDSKLICEYFVESLLLRDENPRLQRWVTSVPLDRG